MRWSSRFLFVGMSVLLTGCQQFENARKKVFTGAGIGPATFRLVTACKASDLPAISKLVREGADVNDTWQNMTPLMYASQDGNLSVVQLLLSLGADPKKSLAGATALNYATSNRHHDISILLLKLGIDPNSRPKIGPYDSPLATAILAHDKALFEALLAAGAVTSDATALQAALVGCSRSGWDASYARLLLEKSPELRQGGGLGGAIAATSLKLCPAF